MKCTAINLFLLVCGLLAAGSVAWGEVPVAIVNPGFEDPDLADGAWQSAIPGWTVGWYELGAADPNAWVVGDAGGVYDVSTSEYTSGLAPEGQNMAYTEAYAGYDCGINHVLAGFTSALQADATYVLSATVGNPYLYNGGLAPDYRVELVAGGVVLDSVTGASPVDDTTWATPSLTYNSGAAPAQLREQLEIRLIAVDDPRDDGYEVDYDAISLNATYSHPISDPNGPYTVISAGSMTLDGSGSIPSDGSNISSYDWDLDNDGQFDDFTGVSGTFTRHQLKTTYGMTSGGNTIGLRVTDESPAAGTATSSTSVILGGAVEGQLGILTPETLAAINPATGAPWAAGDQYRFAFIASAKRTAEASDIEDYNTWVQNLANATTAYGIGVDEGATWKVIGSTTDVDARDNTSTNPTVESGHAIFLLDGSTLIANDYADLWDGEIQHIINLTEKGDDPATLGDVFLLWPWTGTMRDGTARTGGSNGSPLGGPGEVGQGNASRTDHWIWRTWTMDPMTNVITMYALSDPLYVTSALVWDADTGTGEAQDGDGWWRAGGADWWRESENIAWNDTRKSVAIFGAGNATADPLVTVDTVVIAGGIVFNDANGYKYTLRGGSITLEGSAPTIEANVDARIESSIAGSGGLTKTGPGTLEVTGFNLYTGGVAVTGGTLVGHTNSLLGDCALSGGSNVTFDQGFDASYGGTITGDGSVTKTGAGTLEVTSASHDYSGDLAVQAGKLLVTGTLPATSTVIVEAGGTLGGTGWAGAIDLHGSVAPGESIGTLNANDNVTLGAGAAYEWEVNYLDGAMAGVDSDLLFTMSDLIVSATSADPLTIKVISLDALGDPGPADGTLEASDSFEIAQAAFVDGFSADAFTIDTRAFQNPMGYLKFVAATRGGSLYLDVLEMLLWTGATDDGWDIGQTANWSEASLPRQYTEGDHLIFDDTAALAPLVDIKATVNPGSVLVDNEAVDFEFGGAGSIAGSCGLTKNGAGMLTIATSNTYTGDTRINAGSVTVASDGALGAGAVTLGDTTGSSDASLLVAGAFTVDRNITVQDDGSGSSTRTLGGTNPSGTAVFSGQILLDVDLALTAAPGGAVRLTGTLDNSAGNTLTKIGQGTAIVDATQTHGPGSTLTVEGGTVELNTDAGGFMLTVNVNASAAHFGSAQHLLALNVNTGSSQLTAGGANVLTVKGLSIDTADSSLDLTNNTLVVDYTGGPSPFDAIHGYVASGCNGGSWDGLGITSSAAAAMTLTALAVIDNSDPNPKIGGLPDLDGEPVSVESVLVKYTWWGDADLDGVIDSNDYDLIDNTFALYDPQNPAPPAGGWRWAVGDFTYDGVVDSNDYDKIDNAFVLQDGGLGLPAGGPVPTPEPASAALVLAGLAWLARRARRVRRG